jgi:hypothetical protein
MDTDSSFKILQRKGSMKSDKLIEFMFYRGKSKVRVWDIKRKKLVICFQYLDSVGGTRRGMEQVLDIESIFVQRGKDLY